MTENTNPNGSGSSIPGPDHGFTLRKRRRAPWIIGGVAAAAVAGSFIAVPLLNPPVSAAETDGATLIVATAEGNHAEQSLIEFIDREVAPKHGIDIEFKGLSDSNTINRAVSEGEVAGTIYQHKLWLGQVLEANPDFRETAVAPVFRWGFGIWSDKYTSIEQIPDGGTVSLYSDPANEAQGLWLLERAGLITLKDGINKWEATQDDIASNPKNLKFTLLDFGAQSRALPDLDAAVGYTEYYVAAKIPLEKQIYAPAAPDEFASQLTVGTDYLETDNIKKLTAAFTDPAVQEFLSTDPSVKDLLLPVDAS